MLFVRARRRGRLLREPVVVVAAAHRDHAGADRRRRAVHAAGRTRRRSWRQSLRAAAGVLPRRGDADAGRATPKSRSKSGCLPGWNGKLQSVGNGAWAGNISATRRWRRRSRPATPRPAPTPGHAGGNANFIVGHPEKLVDFEERAVHEMTGAAKAIADAFYGQRAATRLLQRLLDRRPPGADRSAALSGRLRRDHRRRAGQLREAPDVRADLAVAGDAQGRRRACSRRRSTRCCTRPRSRQCDALDGVKDGVIENPTQCEFDPKVTLCQAVQGRQHGRLPDGAAGRGGAENLRGRVERAHARAALSRPAARQRTRLEQSVAAQPVGYATDFFKYIVFKDEKWDPKQLNFDADVGADRQDGDRAQRRGRGSDEVHRARRQAAHLSRLERSRASRRRTPSTTTRACWRRRPTRKRPATRSARSWCRAWGTAAAATGRARSTWWPPSIAWVETKASRRERIPASRMVDGQVVRTRPLCAYPQTAVYNGTGSTDDASNFVCK